MKSVPLLMWGLGSALCHHLARRDLGADTVPEPGRGGGGGGDEGGTMAFVLHALGGTAG